MATTDSVTGQQIVQIGGPSASSSLVTFAYEQVTVANVSIGLTAATYLLAIKATLRLETAEIRFRVDGGAPTTTVGTLLEPGETLELTSNATIASFRAIRTGAVSGSLSCTYEKAS